MEAVIEQVPRTGNIQLTIQINADFHFSAKAAQRLARRFVADEIGYLLRVGEPVLVAGEALCWRLPIILALPAFGAVGEVGEIDVDVETGRILLTATQVESIRHRAHDLGDRYASSGAPA
jgi:hypothetical protein